MRARMMSMMSRHTSRNRRTGAPLRRRGTTPTRAAAAGAVAILVAGTGAQAGPAAAIVGGTPAEYGAYPYMVSVRENGFAYCGGTLVAPRWVLTAAHCANGRSTGELEVVADQIQREGGTGPSSAVDRMVVDPQYDQATESYDAALLHLSTPIDGIPGPARIAPGDTADQAAGTLATVIGFGSTLAEPASGGGAVSYPNTLQQTRVALDTDQECSAVFDGKAEPAVNTGVMLCAGGNGRQDACVGDSGGPLLVPAPVAGGLLDIGITSWGSGCAVAGVPGVYTRLANSQISSFITSTVADG